MLEAIYASRSEAGVSVYEYLHLWTPEDRRDFWTVMRVDACMAYEARYRPQDDGMRRVPPADVRDQLP